MSHLDVGVHFAKSVKVNLRQDGGFYWLRIDVVTQFENVEVEEHELAIYLRDDCVLDLGESAAEAFAESRVQCTDCGAEVPEEFADEHWGKYRETVEPNGPDGYMYFCPKHDPGPEL